MNELQTIPAKTTHIRQYDAKCNDGVIRPFTTFYRVTPVTFNDGSKGTKIQYYNHDFEAWRGCANSYDEVLNLINSNDKTITIN